ncbi:hypothetical protein VCUG_01426 [Vavraia culicis subsp. floridensis]|uniref:Uncharacterized protein n=1 Tax=Vavraia culicis (isolate floridensis) TaxID=948595 RepID=L2GVE2_VAVCU|nr:uncharacterized protein VCUG_01426 [Vavraia culicis subsp. floridensis]ELA47065.2 hypothetical protein VCUG_01426 [Vavraia culicis subsp. floridensis]
MLNKIALRKMDLRTIIANAQIKRLSIPEFKPTYTSTTPPEIPLDTIDDLTKICSYFDLPQPTKQMFEDETQLDQLVLFLKNLRLGLLGFGVQIEEIKIDETTIRKAKGVENDIDRMEIAIANMEDQYNLLREFRREVFKYNAKSATLNLDEANSTSDVKKKDYTNIFVDRNAQIDGNIGDNDKEAVNVDVNMINEYVDMLNNVRKDLSDSPFIKYKDIVKNFNKDYLFKHRSYLLYKNMKKRQILLDRLYSSDNTVLKHLFIELIRNEVVYLAEMEAKYGLERVSMFKIVYNLISRGMIDFDKNNECIRLGLNRNK